MWEMRCFLEYQKRPQMNGSLAWHFHSYACPAAAVAVWEVLSEVLSEDIPDVQWLTCSIRSSSVFAVCLASASWRGPRLVWQHSASIQWGSLCFGVCVRKSHVHWIGQDVGNRLRKHEHPQNQRNYICLSQSLEANISPSSTCTWPSWPWYTMRIWIWFEHSIPAVLVHYHNPLKLPYWDTPDFWTHTHTLGAPFMSRRTSYLPRQPQWSRTMLRWLSRRCVE